MKRALYVFFFFVLVAEGPGTYAAYWHLPFGLVYELLFDWKPLVAPFVDIFSLVIALRAPALRLQPDPVLRAMQLSAATLAVWAVYGVATGGNSYQIQFQVHTLLAAFLFAVACRRVLRTTDDYLTLGRVLVYAALYRASMCSAFYFFVLRENVLNPMPEFCTSHDDTVLFVVALVALWLHLGMFPQRLSKRRVLFMSAVILAGIQFNNRRLAWVSLIGALVMLYAALPPLGLRQRFQRYAVRIVPWIALYVAVGWGRPESVFKPLRSLSSVTPGQEDASTRSRDAENAGLIFTLQPNPALGIGWGHEYTEVDTSLSARVFLQYRYLPHNSVLGLLAFTGFLGFTGVWLIWPVSVFLAARASHHARAPAVRYLGMMILVELVVCLNQVWGDMGLISYTTLFVAGTGFAAASQLTSFEPSLAAAEGGGRSPRASLGVC